MQYIPEKSQVPWQFSLNQNKFLVIIIIRWQYAVSQKENLAIWWPSSAGRRLPLSSSIIIPQHNVGHYHTIPHHTIQYHTIPYHTIPCNNTSFAKCRNNFGLNGVSTNVIQIEKNLYSKTRRKNKSFVKERAFLVYHLPPGVALIMRYKKEAV